MGTLGRTENDNRPDVSDDLANRVKHSGPDSDSARPRDGPNSGDGNSDPTGSRSGPHDPSSQSPNPHKLEDLGAMNNEGNPSSDPEPRNPFSDPDPEANQPAPAVWGNLFWKVQVKR